jgi:hypothetical protein
VEAASRKTVFNQGFNDSFPIIPPSFIPGSSPGQALTRTRGRKEVGARQTLVGCALKRSDRRRCGCALLLNPEFFHARTQGARVNAEDFRRTFFFRGSPSRFRQFLPKFAKTARFFMQEHETNRRLLVVSREPTNELMNCLDYTSAKCKYWRLVIV